MQGVMFFKKFMMPCGLCAAVPVVKPLVKPVPPPKDTPANCTNNSPKKKFIKPSELPIYTADDEYSRPMPCADYSPSALEQQIGDIRKSLTHVFNKYEHLTNNISKTIGNNIEHTKNAIEYIREDASPLPRVGLIFIGGFSSWILFSKGTVFSNLCTVGLGMATMGAFCYPKEAEEGFNFAKHYANISYNFIYGVKPGDGKQLELALPELPKLKMPSSFSEFLQLAVDAGSAAASAGTALADKALKSVTDKKEKSPKTSEAESK